MTMAGGFDADVVVLGAGISGLAAARKLAEGGLRVLVLEARERVGGRVFSARAEGGQVVELGAEFVHGRPPELWSLIEEAGLETVEREGSMLREVTPQKLAEDEQDESFAALDELEDYSGPDEPFAAWLAHSHVPEQHKAALTGYVEGFNAADAGRVGIRSLGVQQKAEDKTQGDRLWHVREGYAKVVEHLAGRVRAAGGEVRLRCEVLAIRWRAGEVEVETNTGGLLHTRCCVVTLPLSLLQKVNDEGGVRIAPEPAAVRQARRLEMGEVVRFTLLFRDAWWKQSEVAKPELLEEMSFLFMREGLPSVWWTQHPERELYPTLTGWVGGPRARALQGKSAEELGAAACDQLAAVFALDPAVLRGSLVSVRMHDWSADPFAAGAYSYVPAGAMDAPAAIAQGQADTLFFAGEHTDTTGHWGTVHAALRSGMRAAEQVLRVLHRE